MVATNDEVQCHRPREEAQTMWGPHHRGVIDTEDKEDGRKNNNKYILENNQYLTWNSCQVVNGVNKVHAMTERIQF